jgi:hypothetical protein
MFLTSGQELFLGISFVIVVIIMIIVQDKMQAMLIVGLIANFLLISTQLTLIDDRRADDKKEMALKQKGSTKESMSNHRPIRQSTNPKSCNFTNGTCSLTKKCGNDISGNYPGSIDGLDKDSGFDISGEMDDDLYFAKLTGDDKIIQQSRIRGGLDRINPKNNNLGLMKKYIMSELDVEEAKPWWGRDE